jgi:transposase
LAQFRELGLLKSRGKQRTDSTHVLAAIRALNRLECVGETMRHALNTLAVAAPDFLLAHSQAEWVDRYGPRVDDYRLPESQAARQTYAESIGADGLLLLTAIYAPSAPVWLRDLKAVQTLRQVWVQNYTWVEGQLGWRDSNTIPPAELFISSPYDVEAHYAKKRSTSWVGYKVHLGMRILQDTQMVVPCASPVTCDRYERGIFSIIRGKTNVLRRFIPFGSHVYIDGCRFTPIY